MSATATPDAAHAAPFTDPATRNRAYADAERLLLEDAPVILLYHPISYVMLQRLVHGYAIHPLLPPRFVDVWLDPEPAEGQGTSAGS